MPKDHILHELERSKANKKVYRCLDPDCNFYLRRERLIGKRAICHGCKRPFILSNVQLHNKHPVCEFCSKSHKKDETKVAQDLATQILNEIEQKSLEEIPPVIVIGEKEEKEA